MTTYIIQQASSRDAGLVAPLFNEYRKFYGQKDNIRICFDFLISRLESDESIIFYAFDESKKICCGFVQLYPSFSSVKAKRILILNDLFTDLKYRSQGIAKALIQSSHNYAKAHEFGKISLEASIDNHNAQKLYNNMGYKIDNSFLTFVKNRF